MLKKTAERTTDQVPTITLTKDVAQSLKQIANCLGYIAVQMSAQQSEDKDKDKPEKVVVLYYLAFTRDQIAAILQITVNAVNLHLFKQGITRRNKGKTQEAPIANTES